MQKFMIGEMVLVRKGGFKYSGEVGIVDRVESTDVGLVYGVAFPWGHSSYKECNLALCSRRSSDSPVALVRQGDGKQYAYWSSDFYKIGNYVLVSGKASGTPWRIEMQASLEDLQRHGYVPRYFRPSQTVVAKVVFPEEEECRR